MRTRLTPLPGVWLVLRYAPPTEPDRLWRPGRGLAPRGKSTIDEGWALGLALASGLVVLLAAYGATDLVLHVVGGR